MSRSTLGCRRRGADTGTPLGKVGDWSTGEMENICALFISPWDRGMGMPHGAIGGSYSTGDGWSRGYGTSMGREVQSSAGSDAVGDIGGKVESADDE